MHRGLSESGSPKVENGGSSGTPATDESVSHFQPAEVSNFHPALTRWTDIISGTEIGSSQVAIPFRVWYASGSGEGLSQMK
jgi:hypothetical protein